MDLTLTDEQEMLARSAVAFVERECPPPKVRAIGATADGFDAGLWSEMAALGWCGLAVDEHHGGAAQGLVEMAVLAEALGRGPVPSPLVASAVAAASAITWAGTDAQRSRWLPVLAAGTAVGTVAMVPDEMALNKSELVAVDDSTVSGTWVLVPWASVADVLVVDTPVGMRLVEPGCGGCAVVRHDDLGADPLFSVELDRAPAEPLGGADFGRHAEVRDRVADHVAVARLADAVGSGERALELVVAHARERHQFGRPIGSFQAVAHRCVDMRTDLDACRYLARRAAWSLDQGRPSGLEVGAALAYATEALRAVFVNAHQVLGALGFSTEHDLHLFTRRAKAFELDCGGTARHLERVAADMGLG